MNDITTALTPYLITLLITIISIAIAYLNLHLNKLNKKVETEISILEDESTRNLMNNLRDDVYQALYTAAKAVEESTVRMLKAAAADGKLSKEDQTLVYEEAKRLGLSLLNTTTKELLTSSVDDVNVYLDTQLNAILNTMKITGENISSNKE